MPPLAGMFLSDFALFLLSISLSLYAFVWLLFAMPVQCIKRSLVPYPLDSILTLMGRDVPVRVVVGGGDEMLHSALCAYAAVCQSSPTAAPQHSTNLPSSLLLLLLGS